MFQLGAVLATATLLPLGLGWWLDRAFSTTPLFTLAGGLLGILIATVGVVRTATRALNGYDTARQTPDNGVDRKESEE